jgi:hypothetical protein
MALGAFAFADPSSILIHYDYSAPYGDAVVVAAQTLWPGATILPIVGDNWPAFNTALTTGTYDIIVLEDWYYNTDNCDWATLLTIYNTTDTRIFLSDWKLGSGSTGIQPLRTAMGVTGVSTISGSVIPHYAWEPAHAICDGISDWGWQDPGLGVLNNRLTVSTAVPVTGWTSGITAGQAGICVANDGFSIVSGYTPAYANSGLAIWTNILEFMANTSGALEQSTWGAIKAGF